MPAGSIEAVKAAKVAKASERSARKEQRQSDRAERLQERREAKQKSDEAAVVKLSQNGKSEKPASSPAPVTIPAQSSSADSKPAPETKKQDNFIGSTAGAKVINFAVQGGQGGDKIAIFASGEGPNAKKVPEKKVAEKTEEPKSVDAQA